MPLNRLGMLSVHTSPLAKLGGEKTGGMNVYIRELATEIGKQGIAVDIFTRRNNVDHAEIDLSLGNNIRVIHISAGPKHYLDPNDIYSYLSEFTAGLIAFTTKHDIQYDAIYSHYWLSGWVAQKLKEIWGTPFAQMFHTLGHMKNRIVPGYLATLPPDSRVITETQITQWADRIIAATPAEQAQLLWLYRADRRKIIVIPPGVNADRFQATSMAEAKSRIGLPQSTNHLLFVGRIEPLKAVDTILLAISHLQQHNPQALRNFQFSIIGGDPNNTTNAELVRLKQLVVDLSLNPFVQFLGAHDQTILRDYYAASLAVVMPSDYESFGLVALEAMASGAPVIASEVGGLAYLVRDGQTGFLIPARDPEALAERILKLINQPELRGEMGQAASELAQSYSWSSIASQIIPLFRELAEQATGGISHRMR